jgi:hypothetical protein
MKSLVLRILVLTAIELVLSFTIYGQTRCDRDYRTCVRACNATRGRTLARNALRRSQIRIQLAQELTQCNLRHIGDPAGRQSCRNEKLTAANAALAELNRADRQAGRDRLSCITECRRQLRECQEPPRPEPTVNGGFTIECLEGGPPCRGAVKEFCTMASGACDDCWRSLCGGGEWLIDSEVQLRSVTLVAVSDTSSNERVLATSSIRGKRAILNVPRDLRLESGEQLFFQFSSRAKPHKAVKITIHRDRH